MSSFETCNATYSDTTNQLQDLLLCMSTADADSRTSLATGLDAFFLIYGGALVFFMQTGFAMLCAGSIRAKNAKNVLLWNLLDSAGGGIAFWSVGYAFAYGGDLYDGPSTTFVGTRGFFMQGDDYIRFENWFFQFAFACAVSSIVAGTIAERLQMRAYLLYSAFTVGFVYPVVAHSFWSAKGFLTVFRTDKIFDTGVIDFAGSGPVHMLGGVTALTCALVLGPRIGRFHDRDGNLLPEPNEFPPHSVALQFLGTFALWFGWYGFNPGSTLNVSSTEKGQIAALAAVNTTLAACAGALSALFTSTAWDYQFLGYHTYDLTMTMNGCLTGLVAITAGCASVDTWAAVVIGICAGWVYMFSSKLILKLRIDDAVDAIPVHMFGGMWGVAATGLFSDRALLKRAYGVEEHAGWFMDLSDFTMMGAQLVGILFILAWTGVVTGLYFILLNYLGWLRVSAIEEEAGMDLSRHKGSCYDIHPVADETIKELHSSRHGGTKHVIPMQMDEPPKKEAPDSYEEDEA